MLAGLGADQDLTRFRIAEIGDRHNSSGTGRCRRTVGHVHSAGVGLFHKDELSEVWKLRRVLLALESGPALELLIDRLKSTKSNAEFLASIAKSGQ